MLRLNRWIQVVKDFCKRNQANAVEAYAAQAALFVVMSFFPAALLVFTLLPLLPFSETQVTGAFLDIVPSAIAGFARDIVEELYTTATSVTLISFSAVFMLWSASKGSVALMRGLDRIYGVHRTRGYLFLRMLASFYLLLFFLVLMLVLAFLGFGSQVFNWLSQWVPVLSTSVFVKGSLQFLVSFAVLFVMFLLLYIAVPQRRTSFFREMPGALMASVGWVGFSWIYSIYLDNIGGFSLYYGSLSLLMFSLIWLYFCMYIFFVGAEVNVWLQETLWPRTGKPPKKKKRHKT